MSAGAADEEVYQGVLKPTAALIGGYCLVGRLLRQRGRQRGS